MSASLNLTRVESRPGFLFPFFWRPPQTNMRTPTDSFSWPIRLIPAAVMMIAAMTPALGHADAQDGFNFAVGTSVRYDDNLFRLPSGSPAPNTGRYSSKSDMLYTAYVGVRLDKPYGQQRLQMDITATQYSYRTNDYLNFSAVDYRAAWLWAITPRLTGTLSADQTSELASYATLQNATNRNKRVNENQRLTADWWVDGGWHLVGGVYRLRSIADGGELTAAGNYIQDTAEGGVRYVSAANNTLAAVQRTSRGDYIGRTLDAVNVLDTRYNQNETELHAIYQVTGHSLLDARLAYRNRTHEHFSQRNYSGTVGGLSYQWMPTGKLQFTLATGRDLVAYQESANSYYATNYISLTPAWLISDKTTIRLKLDLSKNEYHGAVAPTAAGSREDTVRSTQFSVAWRPTRTINVDGYLTHEQRSSNFSGLPYQANIAGVSASATF